MSYIKKISIKKIIISSFIIFIVFWFVSLIHVWVLTSIHADFFIEIITSNEPEDDWFAHIFYGTTRVRVLEFSGDFARVYFTPNLTDGYRDHLAPINFYSRRFSGGDIFHFRNFNDEWRIVLWETVWSGRGSADGFIWPLIR